MGRDIPTPPSIRETLRLQPMESVVMCLGNCSGNLRRLLRYSVGICKYEGRIRRRIFRSVNETRAKSTLGVRLYNS